MSKKFKVKNNDAVVLLARELAEEIFRVGNSPGAATSRIQFMSGTHDVDERSQGGLCLSALENVLAFKLRELFNIK